MGASIILCRYGEITLKGSNRALFERRLRANIRNMLTASRIAATVSAKRGRTLVQLTDSSQGAALVVLQRVFGLTSVSVAHPVELSYPAIEQVIIALLQGRTFATFRVTAQRLQKTFEPTPQIHQKVGRFIEQHFRKKVDLSHPDLDVGIEILDQAYVFIDRHPAPGGLPTGIEGTVLALVESPAGQLAAWLAMKRGCSIIPVQRKPFPITLLQDYGCSASAIRINHLKELDAVAEEHSAMALVTGQTLDELSRWETALPVLRPLVGYAAPQITEKLEELQCTRSSPR